MSPKRTIPSWVQGLREPQPDETHQLEWQEVLLRRLAARFLRLPSGDTTLEAERVLQFPKRMVYYYVGRCVPDFGAFTVASKRESNLPQVTPFDTGALASNQTLIVNAPPLPNAQRAAFVAEHTYAGIAYERPLDEWLDDAFSTRDRYARDERPGLPSVPSIDLKASLGDERVWTWEARLPAEDYDKPPVSPLRVFFSEGNREAYVDWVRATDLLDGDEKRIHRQWVYENGSDDGDAAQRMRDLLIEEMTP